MFFTPEGFMWISDIMGLKVSQTQSQLLSVCRYRRLEGVCDRLTGWEEAGQQVPLEELLGSTLKNIRRADGETSLQPKLDGLDHIFVKMLSPSSCRDG